MGESPRRDAGVRPDDGPPESGDEALFDAWLDAALAGDVQDPEVFRSRHPGAGEGLQGRLANFHRLLVEPAAGAAVGREPLEPDPGLPFVALGEYRLIRRLGEGGMGVVYLAEQASLDRLVALKVIRPELVGSPTAVARLRQEARSIARLRHPNLVAVHTFGEERGVHWFVMDLVMGRGLDAVLEGAVAEQRELPIRQVVGWGRQIAEALACAHAEGIIHRDVKTSNILIDGRGDARLVDFGLARDLTEGGATLTSGFAGSPSYAAPEQIDPARGPIGPAADVYSLGTTIYETLSGRVPFSSTTVEALMRRILIEDPPLLRRLRPAVPRDLEVVVAKAMEKDPADRFPTARELASDLGAVLDLRPITARPPGPLMRLAKWARRHRAAAAIAGIALLLVVASALFLVFHDAARRRADREEAVALVGEAESILEAHEASRVRADAAFLALSLARTSSHRGPITVE